MCKFGFYKVLILRGKNQERVKLITIYHCPSLLKTSEEKYSVHSRFCCTTLNGEIVLINSRIKPNWIFFYDLKTNSSRETEILGLADKFKIIGIYSYEDSLCSLGQIWCCFWTLSLWSIGNLFITHNHEGARGKRVDAKILHSQIFLKIERKKENLCSMYNIRKNANANLIGNWQ